MKAEMQRFQDYREPANPPLRHEWSRVFARTTALRACRHVAAGWASLDPFHEHGAIELTLNAHPAGLWRVPHRRRV